MNANCTALCQICQGQMLKKEPNWTLKIMVGKCDGGWPKAMLKPKGKAGNKESVSSIQGSRATQDDNNVDID